MAVSNAQTEKAIQRQINSALRAADIDPTTKNGNRELSKLVRLLRDETQMSPDQIGSLLADRVVATHKEREKTHLDGASVRLLISQRRSLDATATPAAAESATEAAPETTPETTPEPTAEGDADAPSSEATEAPATEEE